MFGDICSCPVLVASQDRTGTLAVQQRGSELPGSSYLLLLLQTRCYMHLEISLKEKRMHCSVLHFPSPEW